MALNLMRRPEGTTAAHAGPLQVRPAPAPAKIRWADNFIFLNIFVLPTAIVNMGYDILYIKYSYIRHTDNCPS